MTNHVFIATSQRFRRMVVIASDARAARNGYILHLIGAGQISRLEVMTRRVNVETLDLGETTRACGVMPFTSMPTETGWVTPAEVGVHNDVP